MMLRTYRPTHSPIQQQLPAHNMSLEHPPVTLAMCTELKPDWHFFVFT